MMSLTLIMFFVTLLMGLIFLGFFCWAVKDGQFEDVEEAKYEMFREADDAGDEE